MKMYEDELQHGQLKSKVKGRCQEYCPISEQKLRKRERLVHKLECFEVNTN